NLSEKTLEEIKIKISENDVLLKVISFLGSDLQENFYMKSVQKNEGVIRLVGRSIFQEDIDELLKKLNEHFKNHLVSIQKTTHVDEGDYKIEFEMVILLK